MSQHEVEVIGQYDPELKALIREVRRNQSYFNNLDESSESHVEQISQMEEDPILSLVEDKTHSDQSSKRPSNSN
ncbi:hypothetical protein [Halosimplex pelagicum]|uniref:Uncharacterized protein n=1 Tax=Halosimplex pelagicum TaxID=869886 RepID=A0A7D5TEB7_9EURY|nr:hypothetical protein [Halosimplex pelagicum]QLH83755.1 hypothetical protein HZS54_19910 [Halosimplex pelagicum]